MRSPVSSVVLLTVLFGVALGASLFASDLNGSGKVGILAAGLVVSALTYYTVSYLPVVKARERYLGTLVPFVLEGAMSDWRAQRPGGYTLRSNVMRVRRRTWKPWRRFLRIDFAVGSYTRAELEQDYNEDVGCCGTALRENTTVWFDAVSAQEPWRHMSQTQRHATSHVKSILSVPIYRWEDHQYEVPVAILNLDSSDDVTQTGFDQVQLHGATGRYARLTSGLF